MGFYRGQDGTLTIGGSAPGEIQDFTLNISSELIESTAKGSDWKATKGGHKSWSGSVTFNLDYTSAPQVALITAILASAVASQTVALVLYPAGNTAGLRSFTGNAYLSELVQTSPEGSSKVSFSANFTGDGALTIATIS